jgi:6-pyruvoyl-tetrahydropterin synthase
MTIHRLLKNSTLEPKAIGHITEAYEHALITLCVKDRDAPLTETIAKTIIKIVQTGVHEPAQLSALAIEQLGIR